MEIINTSHYQINHTDNVIKEIIVPNESNQLSTYVKKLLGEISTANDKRKFNFRTDTTQVRSSINLMLSERFSEGTKINAERLLTIERQTQERINLNIEIQKGILFQALIRDSEGKKIIISKADHNKYLDETDFKLHTGLPWKKKIFKAIVINFTGSSFVDTVFVYDTNYTMAKYWWQDYLELRENYTDSENTKRALDLLDRKIFKPLEKDYPADYIILRNMMVGFFRTQQEFNIERFTENTLSNYQAIHEDLPVEGLKKQVLKLPENGKWGFDSRFSIDKHSINKRIKKRIKLNDGIELILDHVEGLINIISAEVDDEGNKYIKIRATDESYKYFCRPCS